MLSGVLVLVVVAWALWFAAWVRRVELRARLEPLVRELGLAWAPHGLRARVCAAGEIEGRMVEIRARVPADAPRLGVRIGGGPWAELPGEADAEQVRARVRGAATAP